MTPPPFYFDLTEALLSASAKRIQYYGIARTVIEVGHHLARLDASVRFVVFSFGHGTFHEVTPDRHPDGSVSFPLPRDVDQRWARTDFGGALLPTALATLLRGPLGRRNRRAWAARAGHLPRIDLAAGSLISAGRPKLMVDMIKALRRAGSRAEIVPLLHDFMPLHRGATKRFRSFDRNFLNDNQLVIRESRLILTNSVFTQEELHRFAAEGMLPPPPRTVAVPLVQHCASGLEPPELGIPAHPYVLTVGSNLGRKNIEAVIEALTLLLDRGEDAPGLVIAGAMRKRLARRLDDPRHAKLRARTTFAVNPSQTDLVRLYENALALVIPSRIEGWGLPAGEALWCGTPAICSTSPVFREVCGDLGLYFDPDLPEDLAAILHRLMSNPAELADLRARIAAAKPTLRTWGDVAADVLAALA